MANYHLRRDDGNQSDTIHVILKDRAEVERLTRQRDSDNLVISLSGYLCNEYGEAVVAREPSGLSTFSETTTL